MIVGSPITVGPGPSGVAITPNGSHAYVTNAGNNTVSVIDTPADAPVITGTPPDGTVGASYTFAPEVTGTPVPTMTVTAGTLPDGLTLDEQTGAITGTPTTAGDSVPWSGVLRIGEPSGS